MEKGIKKFVSIFMNILVFFADIIYRPYSDKKRPRAGNKRSGDDSLEFRPLRRIKVYAIDRNIYDNQN
jgi:hypothetical protein